MITWKQTLAEYEWLIHQIWYLEVEKDDVIEKRPRLIPNPRAHLLFTPNEQDYCYLNDKQPFIGKGCHLLLPSEQMLILEDSAPLKRIGITFRPEGLYLLNKASPQHINQCSWFEWLKPLFNAHFQDALWQAHSKQDIGDVILKHLNTLDLNQNKDKAFFITQKATLAIEELHHNVIEDSMDIESLANHCACSRRTLERSFKQVTGLTVKKYLQMMTLDQMVLALYKQDENFDWATFSQTFGFCDQSHLIRQLKKQLECTPSNYLQKRDLTIDVYGDFE
ncbi:helix-turn-helix domain-containing protein [Vibrio rumoiensis]|uniref:Transcriptional regulator n=1 Tax=Vibrio rumoiensis 1S-45 TaxID=1188252 RepID=A0A1E5E398_9VIBR|nr:AraC family transcriptional regulator [Vibrio rumoiensis]OEF25793.1 transcriptional regulator [Vibrio rumoiensis 1S-45]